MRRLQWILKVKRRLTLNLFRDREEEKKPVQDQ